MVNDRVLVYSVTTDAFFNDKEKKLAELLMKLRVIKKELAIIKEGKKTENKRVNSLLCKVIEISESESNQSKLEIIESILAKVKVREKERAEKMDKYLDGNRDLRVLRRDSLFTNRTFRDGKGKLIKKEINKSNKVVALFSSSFTRTLKLDTKKVNESVVIVKVYHYATLKNLIDNGFKYNENMYTFFSASSGQMKNKKCVFIRKDLWDTHKDTLLCGLDKGRINSKAFIKDDKVEYGININKYLAYLSLQNTATTRWEDFDIDKVVVCPDLEINVTDEVQFIDRDNYKISPIEKKTLPMNVSDGVGLISPELSKKNFQFRIPWGKGLLSSYPIREHAQLTGNYYITDVWGDTHHIINDDVQIILSASQLKTWKYYDSMDEYRSLFKEYNCEAGKCNEEVETKNIQLNYQYIQSLVDLKHSELETIARATNYDIQNIGKDKDVMLRSLGATEENEKKNYFQRALLMYNNLLNDSHAKEMIKSKKESMVEDAMAGTLRVEGKRMFILPDLYAYCEFLFTGNKNPKGLLGKGEVFAKNLDAGTVDIMRSPQLYREHGIAQNIKNDELEKWFTTGALYTNNADFLARLIQADFDGDVVNVCVNKTLTSVAKHHMKGIVPLYYEMSTAPIQKISEETIYSGLELSFGSSIGSISNDITKIWNSGKFNDDKLSAIKLLTMYNNYMIDFSKTSFLPKPPKAIKREIGKHTKGNMPFFFQYAKNRENVANKVVVETKKVIDSDGKETNEIISEHTPVVNMLSDIILDPRIVFRSVANMFDYTNLMSVKKFKSRGEELDAVIINTYKKINRTKKWMIDKESNDYKENKYVYIANVIKQEIVDAAREIDKKVTEVYVADSLIYQLHSVKKNANKKTLWESFGDIMVTNLNFKLNGIKSCQRCEVGFEAKSHKNKYCSKCSVEVESERKR